MQPKVPGLCFNSHHVAIVCETPQLISDQNISVLAPSILHGKHTLSHITAVSVASSGDAFSFSFFMLERFSCRDQTVRGWEFSGKAASPEEQFTQAGWPNKRKMPDFLWRPTLIWRLYLLTLERLEGPQWQIVVPSRCSPVWSFIHASRGCERACKGVGFICTRRI